MGAKRLVYCMVRVQWREWDGRVYFVILFKKQMVGVTNVGDCSQVGVKKYTTKIMRKIV